MDSPKRNAGSVSLIYVAVQILLMAAAAAFWNQPFIQPIKLLVVLLHEISHGLMALATGGAVQDILITPNEGGACRTDGGNALLIISAGYLGSMFFGGLFLTASKSRGSAMAIYALSALLLIGAGLTVLRDSYSRTFALATAGTSLFLGVLMPGFISSFILRWVGTVSSLYVFLDIYNDILSENALAGAQPSDASALSQLTGISPCAIGLAWLAVSGVYFIIMLKSSLKPVLAEQGSRGKKPEK
ncbi:MAG: M50 family metallopeptidase [Planctomycetes bacterium]|nr:M50 family metallopeptidase [Planctomycetota bacterium]